jgi:hypothetical protein
MKTRLFLTALAVSGLAAAALAVISRPAMATRITSVQGNQSRNQTQNQGGLPPEKKKALSRYGPEDAFPGTNEQQDNRRQGARSGQRSRRSPTPAPAPGPSPSPTRLATPSPIAAPVIPTSPSPTATAAALSNPVLQPPPAQRSSFARSASEWAVPVLSALALIVSIALIYVLVKLREKIREGSGS